MHKSALEHGHWYDGIGCDKKFVPLKIWIASKIWRNFLASGKGEYIGIQASEESNPNYVWCWKKYVMQTAV
jgi:hypothetical protein